MLPCPTFCKVEAFVPSVMLRNSEDNRLLFYIAKKDLEEVVENIEYDSESKWGGEFTLGDGSRYFIEPMEKPRIPITLRARRVNG